MEGKQARKRDEKSEGRRFIITNFICNTICLNFLTLVRPMCTLKRICHKLSISYNTQLSSRAFLPLPINKNAKCEYSGNASATTLQRTIQMLYRLKKPASDFKKKITYTPVWLSLPEAERNSCLCCICFSAVYSHVASLNQLMRCIKYNGIQSIFPITYYITKNQHTYQ